MERPGTIKIDNEWKIVGDDTGLNWEVYNYRKCVSKKTGQESTKWMHCNKYFGSFGRALHYVYQQKLREGNTVRGFKAAVEKAERLEKELMSCAAPSVKAR